MRHAVVGIGYWGKNHARVCRELVDEGLLDSMVLCDIDEDRVAELATSHDVEYVTSVSALLDRDVDSATVATPSRTHREIATRLVEAGLDVLVEKPLATSAEGAWDIVDTADRHGATLGVGHIFRYHPALVELKRRIDRGDLGQLKYLHTNRFSFRVPRAETGVLYSLAVHDVDIYSYLLDERPDSLSCRLDRFVRDDVDETATLVLDYGQATGVINESWQVPVFGKRRDLTVVGSERAAHVDYLADTAVEVYDTTVVDRDRGLHARRGGKQTYRTDPAEPLRVEVESFLDACRRGETPRASGRVGAETIELLELAETADRENRVVSVDR